MTKRISLVKKFHKKFKVVQNGERQEVFQAEFEEDFAGKIII